MQAKRDENRVTTMLGVLSDDGTTPYVILANPTDHTLMVNNGTSGGFSGELVSSYDGAGGSTFGLSSTIIAQGQSFSGVSATIGSCKFKGFKQNSPTGNTYAKIYAATGTAPSITPTGSALAISDAIDASLWPSSLGETPTYQFSGANQITLSSSNTYVITVECSTLSGANVIKPDITIPGTDAGNNLSYYFGSSWSAVTDWDMTYFLYNNENTLVNAKRDENRVTTLMAVSSDDNSTPVPLLSDEDGNLLIQSN